MATGFYFYYFSCVSLSRLTVILPVTPLKVGHYAISFVKAGQVDHMLCLPSYAGNDPSVPGATRYVPW